jgi:hypothetical protein
MSDSELQETDDLRDELRTVRRRLRHLTLVTLVLTLMVTISFAESFGALLNWFQYDALLYSGATAGAALLGFAVGWIARRGA